ncbi:hypothetical protein E1B28_010479 [Marasmius oreades]|uniref:Uncharacterized protein n=1 Tax=Marasmius oreades TaxID=181124 RepID=A0A9P7URJ1_9AGAR|nr:uncharacterized protein E1B28_010479 [Marasmius oreades]KAG7091443.1 hypothetical protein E1B28_010479 [Marasmius oreades]
MRSQYEEPASRRIQVLHIQPSTEPDRSNFFWASLDRRTILFVLCSVHSVSFLRRDHNSKEPTVTSAIRKLCQNVVNLRLRHIPSPDLFPAAPWLFYIPPPVRLNPT